MKAKTVKEAMIQVIAEKLREYYLRGMRDARIESYSDIIPSMLEDFNPGEFDQAHDKYVWLRMAEKIFD
jgi:hypothetical protein